MMVKKDIPADTFIDLVHLQNLNGLKYDYYKRLQITTNLREYGAMSELWLAKVRNSKFIGVMLDETCDISVHQKLAIFF